jgi:hypothetical protein
VLSKDLEQFQNLVDSTELDRVIVPTASVAD